jgi:uncharacterized protein (DUF952 family)
MQQTIESEPLFHITPATAWACPADPYVPADFAREGFIHCSTLRQVMLVADTLFCGRSGLVLLMIDIERIGAPIRYENLEGGSEPFPHIYGPLPRAAVVAVEPLFARSDGTFDATSVERCMTQAGRPWPGRHD